MHRQRVHFASPFVAFTVMPGTRRRIGAMPGSEEQKKKRITNDFVIRLTLERRAPLTAMCD
jgi:hypothetical protein